MAGANGAGDAVSLSGSARTPHSRRRPELPSLAPATVIRWAGIEEWEMREVSSIDLVMDLESIRTGAPMAVPVCALD